MENDDSWMTARQLLGHATTQSAQVVQLGSSIGRPAPGYRADLVLVDLNSPRVHPAHDLANTLVYGVRSDDVDTTIEDGRVLMRGRQLLTNDLPTVLAELAPRLARLTDRTRGASIQTNDA